MKQRLFSYGIGGAIVALTILSWVWVPVMELVFSPSNTEAATSSSVTVTASVAKIISCSTNVTSTTFGTLTDATVATAGSDASTTMSCVNSASGCTLFINDTGSSTLGGGLYGTSTASLIESPNAAFDATATLVAGTEGYGIRATTTSAGGGASLSLAVRYDVSHSLGLASNPNAVGGLTTTTLTLASTTASTSGREVVVTHKAAIATQTPGDDYVDTITYSCTAN